MTFVAPATNTMLLAVLFAELFLPAMVYHDLFRKRRTVVDILITFPLRLT